MSRNILKLAKQKFFSLLKLDQSNSDHLIRLIKYYEIQFKRAIDFKTKQATHSLSPILDFIALTYSLCSSVSDSDVSIFIVVFVVMYFKKKTANV
jgi:hypothetical protein